MLTITTDTGSITGPVGIITELAIHMGEKGIDFVVTKA
jgi:hypothetical protein